MKIDIDAVIDDVVLNNHFIWSFDNYKDTILKIASKTEKKSLFEIGGGRFPLFSIDEINEYDYDYTINDISQRELDKAPHGIGKVCFDISKPLNKSHRTYDFIFSKLVFEHLKDTEQAYKNIFSLLNDGGIFLNFHPTLYCSPFMLNYILPEAVSRKILRLFKKNRHDDGIPKFQAYYNRCFATHKTENWLESIGFEEVKIVPFYGHAYYRKIPLLSQMTEKTTKWSMDKDFRPLASYAYTIGTK
jgi:SAM-dependent methyltransferase